jgi:hypothetical protein
LPTAQRLYRFLDKRFYPPHQPPAVEMDLIDLACGHIGLSRVDNVAELKRRLNPAVAELEGIGFIARAEPAERYRKVKAGIWRVRFQAGPQFLTRSRPETPLSYRTPSGPPANPVREEPRAPEEPGAREMVEEFYRLWGGEGPHVGERDLEQVRALSERHGAEVARGLVPELVRVVKKCWPECKSFSGAASKYGAEAAQAYEGRRCAGAKAEQAKVRREQEREEAARQAERRRQLEARWESLSAEDRADVERRVLESHPELKGRPGILKVFCLKELDRD